MDLNDLERIAGEATGLTPEPWSSSPQIGQPGHCKIAQVWDDNGRSLAELDAMNDAEAASLIAASIATFSPSVVLSLLSKCRALVGERDALREQVPTPLNMWGARGYEVMKSREGPGAVPTWCLCLNGVGNVPIAWFYRKADAQRVIEAEARAEAAEARLREVEGALATARAWVPTPPARYTIGKGSGDGRTPPGSSANPPSALAALGVGGDGSSASPRSDLPTNDETFYRVKAKHPTDTRWQVGDLGDGWSDPEAAERYYQGCIGGGWPVVRMETVRVQFVKEHRAIDPPTPSRSGTGSA